MNYREWALLPRAEKGKKMKSAVYWKKYLKEKGLVKHAASIQSLAKALCKELEGRDVEFPRKTDGYKYLYKQHRRVLDAMTKILKKSDNMVKDNYGVVYFITDENRKYVKIGRTTDLKKRLKAPQTYIRVSYCH